jgi:hypothetical protein
MIEFTKRHKDNIDPSIILPKVDWNVAQEASKKKMTRISKIRRPISNLTWRRLVGQEVLAEETV